MKRLFSLLLMLTLIGSLLTACGQEAMPLPVETKPTAPAMEMTLPVPETQMYTIPATTLPEEMPEITPLEQTRPREPLRSESPGDASGFVLVSDVIPDAILEIRYYSTYNFIGERIDGYEEPCALLTWEAAQALKAVSDELVEKGYRIKIFDAYRPQVAVDHFVRWAQDPEDIRMKAFFYPDVPKSELFSRGYIASRSGHSRGSTVDLTLLHMATGREADMGGPFDFFGELSHGNYPHLTDLQKANRELLREVMTRHGFRSLSTEWWHFTLEEEPYPDLYFTFPVCESSVIRYEE